MALSKARYEVFLSERDGKWYFRLRGRNGEIVAHSESYTRKADAERGAKDARAVGRFARVVTL